MRNMITTTASVMALSMLAVLPASAQDSSNDSPESAAGLDQIIVSARKRTENLQDTPISISAFSQDGLDKRGVGNISEIDTFTPNLQFNRSTANSGDKSAASIYTRGVGQSDFTLTTDPGVGIYLDGVYIARSIGSAIDVLDIERVEVLRGPQGTLFGRNTIGGAVSITSKKPDFYDNTATLEGSVGSFDLRKVRASGNYAISDTVAVNGSILRKVSDGYIDRPLLGDKTGKDDLWAGRVAMRWQPTDRLEFNLSADGTRIRETACCGELVAAYPGLLTQFHNAAIAPTLEPELGPLAFFGDNQIPDEEFVDRSTFDVPSNLDLWGISLIGEYEINDSLSLKSITAYRDFESENGRDADHSPLAINETLNVFENSQFSQELQLQGRAIDDRLKYILGLYYFEEDGFNEDDVRFSIVNLISGGFTKNTSYAGFAQGTFDVTDRLALTAGLRWTQDEKRFRPRQFIVENVAGVPSAVLSTPDMPVPLESGQLIVPDEELETSIKDATPYLNVSYEATDNLLVYGTYSEGFKGGGFVQRNFPDRTDVPSFEPETVQVWEAGFKYETSDRRFRLNGAVFDTEYENLQIQVFDGIAPITQNAAAATIRGFELEAKLAPIDRLLVEAAVGHLDSEYTEIDPNATEIALANELIESPAWTLSAGASYEFDIGEIGVLRPRLDWSYRDDTFKDARNTAELFQPGYDLLAASLIFEDNDGKWLLQLTGRNLSDDRYISSGFADEAVQSVAEASFGRPREWELTVRRRF